MERPQGVKQNTANVSADILLCFEMNKVEKHLLVTFH